MNLIKVCGKIRVPKNSFDFARFCLFLEGLLLFVMFEVKEVELVANKVNSSLIVVHRRPKVTIPV